MVSSKKFLIVVRKLENHKSEHLFKKQQSSEYQFVFKLINKIMLPHIEKRYIAFRAKMILLEALSTFKYINLLALMLRHMHKVIIAKKVRNRLAYGSFLNKVFDLFNILLQEGFLGTRK